MNLTFHPAVAREVNEITAYYRREGGELLAERFLVELEARFAEISEQPTRFPFYLGNQILRRAMLRKFPHLIFIPHSAGQCSHICGET